MTIFSMTLIILALTTLFGNAAPVKTFDITREESYVIEGAASSEQYAYDALASYKTEPMAPCGSYGAVKIYGTTINLSLDYIYNPNDFAELAQVICDDPNRGVAQDYSFRLNGDWVWDWELGRYKQVPIDESKRQYAIKLIADHWNHGFDQLYDLEIGRICKIVYPDGRSQEYVLRELTRNGENNGENILAYGKPAYKPDETHKSDWICMYTCNPEGWWSVTVTFWEPLK